MSYVIDRTTGLEVIVFRLVIHLWDVVGVDAVLVRRLRLKGVYTKQLNAKSTIAGIREGYVDKNVCKCLLELAVVKAGIVL